MRLTCDNYNIFGKPYRPYITDNITPLILDLKNKAYKKYQRTNCTLVTTGITLENIWRFKCTL